MIVHRAIVKGAALRRRMSDTPRTDALLEVLRTKTDRSAVWDADDMQDMWKHAREMERQARRWQEIVEEARGEPIAWMYKTVIHCGQGQFYDSDWKVSLHKPADSAVCVTPLYKAPAAFSHG